MRASEILDCIAGLAAELVVDVELRWSDSAYRSAVYSGDCGFSNDN